MRSQRLNGRSTVFGKIALTCAMVVAGQADVCGAPRDGRQPGEMPAADWSSLRAAYEATRLAITPTENGHVARNAGQRWRTHFDGRGFLTTPDSGEWSWGLELISYGLTGNERSAIGPARTETHGQRISYHWDETLTEWYVNGRCGLEHGYTVHHRPIGDADPSSVLRFTIALRGELCPAVQNRGRDIRFVNADGATIVRYDGLKVLDADGKALPSYFEAADEGLSLVIDDRTARYPVSVDPIAQQAYLKASSPGANDWFGVSVAVSGDTAVVGAFFEDSGAIGVNGNDADNSAVDSGAAYVFVRNGASWIQQAYLKASNTGSGDLFGYAVAISGDTIVVGAYKEDSNATGVNGNQASNSAFDAGAAYVFVRDNGTWHQQAYLKASNTNANDNYGLSVAVSRDTVVVGAVWEDSASTGVNGDQADNTAPDSGAAYAYVRNGTTWSQQAYLKASNTDAGDDFGRTLAISGDTVIIGADFEDSGATGIGGDQTDNSATDSGAAYVFVRSGTSWSEQAYLKASNTDAGDLFGSVAISGDTAVVGASWEDSIATGVDGNQADNSATDSGAAYVFLRSGTTWSQQAYLKASNTGAGDRLGSTVAISDQGIVVAGATSEDSNATGVNGDQDDDSATNSGAAYVFARRGTSWIQQAYLKASNTDAGDVLGHSVAVSGHTIVVGSLWEDSDAAGVNGEQGDNSVQDAGAAYIFDIAIMPSCVADIYPLPAGNGTVDVDDLFAVINSWGPCESPCPPRCAADIVPAGGDCAVTADDLFEVINGWGDCP